MEEAIEQLADQSHFNKANALRTLLYKGFFGDYTEAVRGSLMWRLIHLHNRLNETTSNPYSVDAVLLKMKSCVPSQNFTAHNLKFIQQLIEIDHWGNLRKVEKKDPLSTTIFKRGLNKQYENWMRMKVYN